jgi:hypothetical protein
VWTVLEKAVTEWERKRRRSGGQGEGCGGCPFKGDADPAKEGRAGKAEEF